MLTTLRTIAAAPLIGTVLLAVPAAAQTTLTADGRPLAVTLDTDENVYISDEALQCITIFDREVSFR